MAIPLLKNAGLYQRQGDLFAVDVVIDDRQRARQMPQVIHQLGIGDHQIGTGRGGRRNIHMFHRCLDPMLF
jgi:hypothetical protein